MDQSGVITVDMDGKWPAGKSLDDDKGHEGARAVTVKMSKTGQDSKSAHIDLAKAGGLTQRIQDAIAKYDSDSDGTLDVQELAALMEDLMGKEQKMRYMKIAIIFMVVFTAMLLGTMFGLTWVVVASLKDSHIEGNGYMYVKGSNTELVKVGSAEMMVAANGMLMERQQPGNTPDLSLANTTVAQPLRVTTVAGIKQKFSSQLDIRNLMELNYLFIEGGNDAQLALSVSAVARIKSENSIHGSVVKILTAAGTITLDDTSIIFTTDMAPIFTEGGFVVGAGGRRLLGVYEVFGFFRFIEDLTVFNLPKDEPKPKLPEGNFKMDLMVYEACVVPTEPDVDRCQWRPPMPSVSMEKLPEESRRLLIAQLGSKRGRMLLGGEAYNNGLEDIPGVMVWGDEAKRYMVHNQSVVTKGNISRTEYRFASVPGWIRIEVVNLATAMGGVWQEEVPQLSKDPDNSSIPTPTPVKGNCNAFVMPPSLLDKFRDKAKSNVNFSFVGFEDFDGVASRHFLLSIKQVNTSDVLTVDYWDTRKRMYPLAFTYTHPKSGLGHMRVTNFEVLSADAKETSPSRFALPVKERDCVGPRNEAIEMPRAGSAFTTPTPKAEPVIYPASMINRKVPNITLGDVNVSQYFYNSSIYNASLSNGLLSNVSGLSNMQLRRLLREHIAIVEDVPDAEAEAALIHLHMQRAAEWAALDHSNAQVMYPTWADKYFSVLTGEAVAVPATVPMPGALKSLGSNGYFTGLGSDAGNDEVDPFALLMSQRNDFGVNPVMKRSSNMSHGIATGRSLLQQVNPPEICNTGVQTVNIPMGGSCDLAISTKYFKYLAVEAKCGGAIFPAIKLSGSMGLDLCEMQVQGCISVAVSLTELCCGISESSLVKSVTEKLGIKDINILQVCAGYNFRDRTGYVTGVYAGPPLYLWALKAEIYGTIKFSSCCTWVEKVGAEAWMGVDFGIWSYYSSIGSINFIKDYYFRGSPDAQMEEVNPILENAYIYAGAPLVISPSQGFWGEWHPQTFCFRAGSKAGRIVGLPMRGLRNRVEKRQGWGDDTALNAVEVMCNDNTRMKPHDGLFGDWERWNFCDNGGYVVGARMKIAGMGGDDTAANNLEFRCNNGKQIDSMIWGDGLWGDWTQWTNCPSGSFVCGLQVRFEANQGGGDDSALNGLNMVCCLFK